jgi:hypothetical protein
VERPDVFVYKNRVTPTQHLPSVFSWDASGNSIAPAEGYDLVVVQVRISNGVNEPRRLWTAPADVVTALADGEGRSHSPALYDFPGGPIQSDAILPGAQLTFPVVFSVPKGTEMQDLVFSLMSLEGDRKRTEVRVLLSASATRS